MGMTFEQLAIVGILLAMLIAYVSERFRVEVVAISGLGAGYLAGAVSVQGVFAGFASSAVITVVEILLIVVGLTQTRVIDDLARRIVAGSSGKFAALAILCGMAASVSVFINNIGALALFFPVALSICARLEVPPAQVLMPLSFATLLGGTCSLTGTPANLVVNQWKIAETGSSFSYFELAIIGGPVTVAGLLWIVLAAPRVLRDRTASSPAGFDAGPGHFLAELVVPADSKLIGRHLPDAEAECGLHIHGVVRHAAHVFARRGDIVLASGDTLVAEGDLGRLDELRERGFFTLPPARSSEPEEERIEAVVMPESLLLGSRISDIALFADHAVSVTALASRRHRVEGRFGDLQIGMGDVLVLSGERDTLRQIVAECGLLSLSRRRPAQPRKSGMLAIFAFLAGVLLCAFEIVPPELAFGAVVVALVVTRRLDLRTALQDLNWPIVILLACMIPLGIAVRETGAAHVIADTLADYLPSTHPVVVCALVLLMTAAITPFIDNVSTAVVLSPIAAGIASRTGVPVEPLLMAVAIGASLDFLTPFGHHNNTVVMGAAGYRFSDFPRFGLPLLIICLVVAILAFSVILSGGNLATFSHAL